MFWVTTKSSDVTCTTCVYMRENMDALRTVLVIPIVQKMLASLFLRDQLLFLCTFRWNYVSLSLNTNEPGAMLKVWGRVVDKLQYILNEHNLSNYFPLKSWHGCFCWGKHSCDWICFKNMLGMWTKLWIFDFLKAWLHVYMALGVVHKAQYAFISFAPAARVWLLSSKQHKHTGTLREGYPVIWLAIKPDPDVCFPCLLTHTQTHNANSVNHKAFVLIQQHTACNIAVSV